MGKKELQIGDRAPGFNMPTDGGGKASLASLAGKTVVLYFYPKDDTSGAPRRPAISATTSRISAVSERP